MRLILFLLFPVLLSGQILRPYGVIEIGANFPTSSATGPKFAYRTVDSSFYRWVSGNTWIKIIPALPLDSLVFNPTTAEPDTAELKYSADLETFWFGADGTTIEIGQKSAWYVKNQTGSTITKGTVVRASGTLGSSGRILISPMVIDGTVDSKYLLGIAASDIADGSDGYVIHFGKLRKFNTSSWADGTVLYAGAGGTLTSTEPNPPNLRLPIAFVVHSHATNGVLAIRIQTGNELHELHDVDTTGIDNGGVIVWNAASEKWEASNGAVITTADTTSLLATKYWTNSNFFPIEGGTLTGTGGAGFIGFPSQVTAPGTPASGLNVYAQGSSFNWKGTDGHERQFASTLTGGRTYTLPNVSGTFALGTGTATRIPIWTSTNVLGDSPILYNSTTKRTTWDSPGVIELPMGTDAQRPTATTSDFWYNTTGNGIEWYNGTRWAKGLESTFNRGTATRIPYFNANGQLIDNANLAFSGTNILLTYGNGISFHSAYRANNGSYAIHGHSSGDFRFVGSFDNTTYRHFSFGYYSSDNPASTWNQRFAINSYTGGVGLGTAPGGHVMLPIFGTVTGTALGGFANGFGSWMATTVNAGANNHILIGHYINPTLSTAGFTGVSRYGIVQENYNNIFNRVSGSTGIGMTGGTGNDIDASAKFEIRSTSLGFLPPRMTAANRVAIASPATGLQVYQTDGTEGYYVKYASGFKRFLVEGEGGDGNGIISALPLGNVDIKTNNQLNLKTSGGATGTNFYTGGLTLLKTATGTTGGQFYMADTTGNLDFAYGFVQDDRASIQNGGTGRQITQLLTDFNPTINFRWVNGIRLDTTSSIHVIRVMWGDKNTNEAFPTEFVFNAAMPPGSTASAYNFRTAHNIGRLSLNFDNGIYLKKNTKFFLEADSTFAYSFTDNTLRLSSYGTSSTTATALSKTESGYVAGFATDGTIYGREQKRDTTVYVVDTDLDWSAAITTAQISRRYNRVIFLMTTTAAAGSDSDLTLHTPDVNLMQVEYLIRSTDEAGGFSNVIRFGTNNAVDSTNGLVSSYFPAAGQGVGIRAGLRSGVYKYYYY